MKKNRVISMHYTLTDDNGTTLDSSAGREPLTYLEGAGNIIPGLDAEVAKLGPGEKKKVSIAPGEGYGMPKSELVIQVKRTQLPIAEIKVGDQFQAGGGQHATVFKVVAIDGDNVSLDGNHPLAGKTLHFDVEIVSSRDATEEEMDHGHVHGPHGHHH